MANQDQKNRKKIGLSALPIGIVSAVIGYVVIKGEDGIEKLLKLGDKLFGGDEISTGEDGHAVIDLIDGSKIELGDDSSVVLDDDVIDAKTLEQIQEALLASISPSAGGGNSEGGFDIAQVDIDELIKGDSSGDRGDDFTGSEFSIPDRTTDYSTYGGTPDTSGKIPTLSIANATAVEPAPSGGQGGQGGQDSGHDSGSDSHDSGHDSGSDSQDSGHDSGSDSHDSGSDSHDSGDSGHSGGHDSTPVYAVFTVTLSHAALSDVTVDFTTANGTAVSGGHGVNQNDYGQTSGTLTIPRGQTTGTIEVEILGDRGVESDSEYFYVNLSNAQGAVIADGQAIGTIIDSGHGDGSTGEGDTLVGTAGDDVLTGSGGRDTIYGEAGDDTISGRGGPDTLYGGEGDDTMLGLGGPDTMSGGPGDDVMDGHGAPDVMDGGSGDDTMYGGGGPDLLTGGEGNDMLDGGGSPDVLEGGPGNDSLYGQGGPDVLDGGPGDDILIGGGGGDVFRFDNLEGVDTITDFKPQQGDVIDISAILEGYDSNDPISDFVQLQATSEPDTYELLVNPSGSAMDDFQLLVTLENMQHTTTVDDLLDNGNLIVTTLT